MPQTSDLFVAQPITFHSMQVAKNEVDNATINLMTTQFVEDREIIPEAFTICSDLENQMGDFQKFKVHRKLPVINEILERLKEQPADYYIYTNVDISVRPSFYKFVIERIKEGYDAFVVNRRTIDKSLSKIDEYDKMCQEKGEPHPGFDCFIFKASMLDDFILGDAGLGANWIGRVIITNLIMHGEKFRIFTDEYQTFHIGDDRSWKNPDFADYDEFNRQEMIKILLNYRSMSNVENEKMAYLNEFLYKDMRWNGDGLNPFLSTSKQHETLSVVQRIKNRISNWIK